MKIYLATPYSHDDPFVRLARFYEVNRIAARLMEQGYTVFSPISHSHPIEQNLDADKQGWEFWAGQDIPMLEACDRLMVLMLDGWRESTGVTGEIEHARSIGMPIEYVDAKQFSHAEGIKSDIAAEIIKERQRQHTLAFGGDTAEFDKYNTQNDWVSYITCYAGRASQKVARNEKEAMDFRTNMVKVAALAVAAIQAHDYGHC